MDTQLVSLSRVLFELGCVKFGSFTLKSGIQSPIYIDLRLLISDPEALRVVARQMASVATRLTFDRICVVPLAGMPIGTALCLEVNRPMLYPRAAKEHGTKQTIEGKYEAGETVLLVDDLITRGDSKLEAIAPLEQAGLKVKDVLVLIDREQGGAEDLASRGYTLHSIMSLRQLVGILRDNGLVDGAKYRDVMAYLASS